MGSRAGLAVGGRHEVGDAADDDNEGLRPDATQGLTEDLESATQLQLSGGHGRPDSSVHGIQMSLGVGVAYNRVQQGHGQEEMPLKRD